MIRNIAELLQAFMKEEVKKLDLYVLKHGPTIGDMYEGLSAEILERAIPSQLNLKIVSGFVTDGAANLSGQMDCMLVRGDGEKIPYTNSYKWHVKDVLVVFEIKKNLYSADLVNSFDKLKQVGDSYSAYLFEGEHPENRRLNISPAYKTFSQLTGIAAPGYHEREKLSKENELIYTALFMEQLKPVTIVLGYNGFASEYGLREGLVNFIEKQPFGSGYGVTSFPQLIIGGKFSLIKANGRPYLTPMREGYWDFMLSSKAEPILLMLEVIWTKLAQECDAVMPWGSDLELEGMNEFLRAKPVMSEGHSGWMLKYDELSSNTLTSRMGGESWEPIEVTLEQYVIFNQLCAGEISIAGLEISEAAKDSNQSPEEFVRLLVATTLVAVAGETLTLVSENLACVVMPDGRFIVADNNSGRLERWLLKFGKD